MVWGYISFGTLSQTALGGRLSNQLLPFVIRRPGSQEEKQNRSFDIKKQEVDPLPEFLASL